MQYSIDDLKHLKHYTMACGYQWSYIFHCISHLLLKYDISKYICSQLSFLLELGEQQIINGALLGKITNNPDD